MNGSGILSVSEDVRASFDPVMRALGRVRQDLSAVKDVVTIRPGYGYPQTGKPVPALVVAVTPGTAPVRASELQQKYRIAFNVTEATVEEQEAAASREGPVSFSLPEGPRRRRSRNCWAARQRSTSGLQRAAAMRSWTLRIYR
jgi:hypothetical protein